MDERTTLEFEPNSYMDGLLELRDKDPFRYYSLDPAVIQVLEEYGHERKAADLKLIKSDHPSLMARTCPLLKAGCTETNEGLIFHPG